MVGLCSSITGYTPGNGGGPSRFKSISPAVYAFAIWGLIYTLLGAYAIYSALPPDVPSSKNQTIIFDSEMELVGGLFPT